MIAIAHGKRLRTAQQTAIFSGSARHILRSLGSTLLMSSLPRFVAMIREG